jgi:hypothetical protein
VHKRHFQNHQNVDNRWRHNLCHSDNYRVVIYDRNVFIIKATGNLQPKKVLKHWAQNIKLFLLRLILNCSDIFRPFAKVFGREIILVTMFLKDLFSLQWKGINCKQSTRWQHQSRLKASAFFLCKKIYLLWNTLTYTWDW